MKIGEIWEEIKPIVKEEPRKVKIIDIISNEQARKKHSNLVYDYVLKMTKDKCGKNMQIEKDSWVVYSLIEHSEDEYDCTRLIFLKIFRKIR